MELSGLWLYFLFYESYLYLTFIVSITTLDVTKVNIMLFKLIYLLHHFLFTYIYILYIFFGRVLDALHNLVFGYCWQNHQACINSLL